MAETETKTSKSKRPLTKEKLRSIMEAASALTALGDEESTTGSRPGSPEHELQEGKDAKDQKEEEASEKEAIKRYIPDHKKPDAALTFPEKLMNLMRFADTQPEGYCIAWLADGKSFVIRNPDGFTRSVLPKFFKATKFSSFTRKLYRWGFRQVNRGIGPDDPIIFGNEHFQRDAAELMAKMRSVTAASTRKAEAHRVAMFGTKRPLEGAYEDRDPKRLLLGQLLHQKAASLANSGPGLYGGFNSGGTVSLANALRPSLGNSLPFNGNVGNGMHKQFDLLGQGSLPLNYISQGVPNTAQQYPNPASTAEIVNAAINALRFAP